MKSTIISIVIASVFIGGSFLLSKGGSKEVVNANNVNIVDGVQIVEINAKGGFSPEKSVAKAGVPTIIRFNTEGTFDCSSSVRIPSMDISETLPQSGITDIDIGTPIATLQGTCGMGMYPFEVTFQ